MALAGSRLGIIAILVIVGLYFLLDHTLGPINHEAVGLGNLHLAHAVFGVVLLAGALYVWRMSRAPSKPAAPAMQAKTL